MNKEVKKGKLNKKLSRRNFLGTVGAATAAFTIIPSHVMAGRGIRQPSDMVNVAGIGVGARGGSVIQSIADPDVPIVRPQRQSTGLPYTAEQLAEQQARAAQQAAQQPAGAAAQQQQAQQQPRQPVKLANIYALCDVDMDFSAHVLKGYPKAKIYQDFRKMLDNEKAIDAVVIGTPDHMHAPIAIYAMKMGKHVYVEKPMCKTVFESREMRRVAKEMNVVTTMGNQGHATEGTRQTVEMVRSGAVGKITKVHAFTGVPSWPQGNLPRPAGVPVPKTLNWDLWLGVAPVKPYHPEICHFNWRGLRDYGTGAMGDWGSHILDAPVWALELKYPTKIQASPTRFSDEFWPACEFITYEFPARGNNPPVTLTWFDGQLKPPRPDELEDRRNLDAVTYYGDKGVMMSGSRGSGSTLIPEAAMKDYKRPDPWIPRGTGNIQEDWIEAIRNGTKTSNDFEHSGNLGEIMALASVAVLASTYNTTLHYDGENMRFTNLPEANELLHYKYREGW